MSMLSQQMFLSALVNSPANASLKAGSLPEWKRNKAG